MLLPTASKPSTPISVQGAVLLANTTAKSSVGNGPSTPASQFDDAFASALQEKTGLNKPPVLPQGLTTPITNTPPPDPKTVLRRPDIPNIPDVQTTMPKAIATKVVPEAFPAVAAKTPVPVLPPAPKAEAVSAIGSDNKVKDDNKKESQPVPSQGGADNATSSYPLSTPIIPAPFATQPFAVTNKNGPSTSSQNIMPAGKKKSQPVSSQGGADNATVSYPLAMPIIPTPLTTQSSAVANKNSPLKSSENIIPVAQNARSAPLVTPTPPADTEAFSIKLTAKALPTQSNDSKSEATEQPILPIKPAAVAVSPVEDMSKQIVQPKKTGNSSATNSSSPALSSLGQPSGMTRGEKSQEKEQPVLSVGGVSDDGGSKQEFTGFGAAPAPFAKETKDMGTASEVRPVAQPEVQDNAPSSGAAKEVAIRLQDPSGQTINVKLVDGGGQVQVTVRSSDPVAASALRQDLSSLASSLDKAGWKPEIAVAANGSSFEPVNQARQTDRNNQDSPGNKQMDWQQDTPKKRQSVSELWDELLTNQTA